MKSKKGIVFAACFLILIFVACAPNNEMYITKSAGFWAGLWHGLILCITFIISLFTDKVRMYEVNNSGGWYDFGFLIGAMIALGQSRWWNPGKSKTQKEKDREKDWEEIGVKVEEKIRTGIRNWLEESGEEEKNWEEIAKKVETKIKRELSNWADK